MVQKIIRIGRSAGFIIPRESLRALGLRIGDHIRVEVDRIRRALIIRPASTGALYEERDTKGDEHPKAPHPLDFLRA